MPINLPIEGLRQAVLGTAKKGAMGAGKTALGALGGPWGLAALGGLELVSGLLGDKPQGEQKSFEVEDFIHDPRGLLTDPRQSAYNQAKQGNLLTTALAKQAQQRKPIEFQNMELPGMPPPMRTQGGFAPLDLSAFIAELEGQLPQNNPVIMDEQTRHQGFFRKGQVRTPEFQAKAKKYQLRKRGRF